MSHHGESPLARRYPQLDICDLFVFGGSGGTVLAVTLSPLSGPAGFAPEGSYEFNIDTRGGTSCDVALRVTFGPPGPAGLQDLQVRLAAGPAAAGRDAAGDLLAAGPCGSVLIGQDGVRAWAGRAADPFCIDPAVIGAVVKAVQFGETLDVRALMAGTVPANLFGGHHVNAIVLEVPDAQLAAPADEDQPGGIAVWSTTARRQAGAWQQVQRCATPLIPTLFLTGEADADAYNAASPGGDLDTYGALVQALSARAAGAAGGGDPPAHGARARGQLLPDVLRYQPGTPAHFGFCARNGRGLADPVAEVMFALVTGRAVPLGQAGPAPGQFSPAFPYLAAA